MRNDGNVLVVTDTAGRVLELVQLLVCCAVVVTDEARPTHKEDFYLDALVL